MAPSSCTDPAGSKACARPATLGYRGYAHSCCISINHVVCHGIPSDRTLRDGDIVNVDVTPLLDGWHGDSSRMYLVGDVPLKARRLVDVTYECLMLGIEQARPGARLGDIGAAIQRHAEAQRYGVVREFCGHGVGRLFHDAPEVVHAGRAGTGPELKPGMFFTIEPMINAGKSPVKLLDDGWTAVTRDRSLSAQFQGTAPAALLSSPAQILGTGLRKPTCPFLGQHLAQTMCTREAILRNLRIVWQRRAIRTLLHCMKLALFARAAIA
jgi:methionine aminopeptidase type I